VSGRVWSGGRKNEGIRNGPDGRARSYSSTSVTFCRCLASAEAGVVPARRRDHRARQTVDNQAVGAVEIPFENIRDQKATVVPAEEDDGRRRREKGPCEKLTTTRRRTGVTGEPLNDRN